MGCGTAAWCKTAPAVDETVEIPGGSGAVIKITRRFHPAGTLALTVDQARDLVLEDGVLPQHPYVKVEVLSAVHPITQTSSKDVRGGSRPHWRDANWRLPLVDCESVQVRSALAWVRGVVLPTTHVASPTHPTNTCS